MALSPMPRLPAKARPAIHAINLLRRQKISETPVAASCRDRESPRAASDIGPRAHPAPIAVSPAAQHRASPQLRYAPRFGDEKEELRGSYAMLISTSAPPRSARPANRA